MKKVINIREKRERRKARTRARISGTIEIPRVSVFRSLRGVVLQMIDDVAGKTLAQAHYQELPKKSKNTVVEAKAVGQMLGERASKLGIKKVVFDRSGYRYHGKVKAVAEGLRKAGIMC